LPVEHGAGGDVNKGPPAVVFGLVTPITGLGQGLIEWAAVERAGGKSDGLHFVGWRINPNGKLWNYCN